MIVDSSKSSKREKQQLLDMIDARLRLLKIQRNEALARHDKEAAKALIKKKRKFGSLLHQERLLTSVGLFNYENLGILFKESGGLTFKIWFRILCQQ